MEECNVSFVEVFGSSFKSWEDVEVCREDFERSLCVEFYKRDSYVRGKKSYVCFACKRKPCGVLLKLEQLHTHEALVTVKEEIAMHSHSVPYCREHLDDVANQLSELMKKVSDLQKLQVEMSSYQMKTFKILEDLQHRPPQETPVQPASENKAKPISAILTFFDESEREGYNDTSLEVVVATTEAQDLALPAIVARETRTGSTKDIVEPSIFSILRGKDDQIFGVVGGLEICRRDLVCLRPNEHVNEIVVGAWLTMVHNAMTPTGDVNDCFLVEPTWLQELWTFNKQLRDVDSLKETGERALQAEKIVVPSSTRTVRGCLRDDKQFEFADFVVKILNAMYAIQDDAFKTSVRKTKWFVERNHNRTPRLRNPNDSGIFVCWLVEKLLGDVSPGLINSSLIKAKRAHILSCIVSGSLET
ncbi:hypothetical protein AC1031_007446 [Aphanomyces cochlioides]|nr:hypothetical protein AC1031_007446 [Aphanomyces cochlioides]